MNAVCLPAASDRYVSGSTVDLKAILVTDRDGVILYDGECLVDTCLCFNGWFLSTVEEPGLPTKVTQAALSATFSLSCDQMSKLGLGKAQMVMSTFDEYQIVQFLYSPLILSLIAPARANSGQLLEIGTGLEREVQIIAKAVAAAAIV
ncbi:Ragulator complex protein lamtor3 [Entophlyctis luteolus]|nr:Ragulator complex protein lamtor3 [Entophlyctis luteolus]KAJ3354692.1 Ragulator complex protein lamtor3 [Entophlyctis luteolus]